jgi:hypothetical protein
LKTTNTAKKITNIKEGKKEKQQYRTTNTA